MKKTACCWCPKLVDVRDDFDQWKDIAACSPGCESAEFLFREFCSDEVMNKRAHYLALTRGEDHD